MKFQCVAEVLQVMAGLVPAIYAFAALWTAASVILGGFAAIFGSLG